MYVHVHTCIICVVMDTGMAAAAICLGGPFNLVHVHVHVQVHVYTCMLCLICQLIY